jgi:hypothetical protein
MLFATTPCVIEPRRLDFEFFGTPRTPSCGSIKPALPSPQALLPSLNTHILNTYSPSPRYALAITTPQWLGYRWGTHYSFLPRVIDRATLPSPPCCASHPVIYTNCFPWPFWTARMQSTPTALFRSRFGITNHSPHSCNRTNPSQRFSSSANYLLQVHLPVNNHSSPMVLLLKLNLRGSGFSRNPFLRALAHPYFPAPQSPPLYLDSIVRQYCSRR